MKKILIIITLVLLGLTGCSSFKVTKEQVDNYNASSYFKGERDEFEKNTKYTLPISLMYKKNVNYLIEGQGLYFPKANIIKIANKNKSDYYYISATFNQPDWLFVQKIVFMFDGEPYTLMAEQQQRNVIYDGGVTERYTFEINENFIKKYIDAKKVRFKIYTTEQGNFENYMSGDKDDLKYGNGNKIQDKNLKFLLKASY